jgi:hypothetical protein
MELARRALLSARKCGVAPTLGSRVGAGPRGMALRSSTRVVLGSSSPVWAGRGWVADAAAPTGNAATGTAATGAAQGRGMALRSSTRVVLGSSSPVWAGRGWVADATAPTGTAATGAAATGAAQGRGMALRSSTRVVLGSSSSLWAGRGGDASASAMGGSASRSASTGASQTTAISSRSATSSRSSSNSRIALWGGGGGGAFAGPDTSTASNKSRGRPADGAADAERDVEAGGAVKGARFFMERGGRASPRAMRGRAKKVPRCSLSVRRTSGGQMAWRGGRAPKSEAPRPWDEPEGRVPTTAPLRGFSPGHRPFSEKSRLLADRRRDDHASLPCFGLVALAVVATGEPVEQRRAPP